MNKKTTIFHSKSNITISDIIYKGDRWVPMGWWITEDEFYVQHFSKLHGYTTIVQDDVEYSELID